MSYIIGAKRSAVGTLGGGFSNINIADVAGQVLTATLQHANINAEQVAEVILGNVLPHGQGMNLARQTALAAGLPVTSTAFTINQVCASGLRSVALAVQELEHLPDDAVMVAGGLESMSNAPHMVMMRQGQRLGDATLQDAINSDGLNCAIENYAMGITAENLAQHYDITRVQQDEFAYHSQLKADKAIKAGLFADEIVPYSYEYRGKPYQLAIDEHPRLTDLDKLATLKPVFKKDGTVTAGNASGINDGAAILLLGNEALAKNAPSHLPIAKIIGWANSGVAPAMMGIGPVTAVEKLLHDTDMSADSIDIFEFNEAFAAQLLAVIKGLQDKNIDIPLQKINPLGGAIALGHPLGASGARILVSLLHQLQRQKLKYGVASLCAGGGMGIALMVEMM